MTAGPGSNLHELVKLDGGDNIAGDADNHWPVFSEERVIESDPQVLIRTSYNLEVALSMPAWQATSAFKNVYFDYVNTEIYTRATPRILDALAELFAILDETRP